MEYLKFFEDFNNGIEIIVLKDNDKLLLEGKYFQYKKDDKIFLPISQEYRNKFIILENKLNFYLDNTINPFVGVNKFQNQMRKMAFSINLTEHYVEKFERIYFEDPQGSRGFVIPELYEGIDFIYNNIDIITKNIASGVIHNFNYKQNEILIKTKDNSKFFVVMAIEMRRKNIFDIYLITQGKGNIKMNKKEDQNLMFLHPNTKSIHPPLKIKK